MKFTFECPAAFVPLVARKNRKRYYVAYGGRGSAKSWTFARALLLMAMDEPLRILCAREIQRTIADSVHRLLADQIQAMGLGEWFRVTDNSIAHVDGAEFIFVGLRAIDAAKVKSFEGVDIVWVEEAQALSKKSWEILIPTIRAARSEIWASFNPDLDSDDTYQRFIGHPPENSWVQKVTYRDNPWFPAVLDEERRHLEKVDPEAYRNVWEGEPRSVVEGAIYAREIHKMLEEHRVRPVPYDPALKVHTVWDLGYNDQTSIILVQRQLSEVRVIDYLEDSFLTVAEWVAELKDRKYAWGHDWLPHDGGNRDMKTRKTVADFMRHLGRSPKVIPKMDVEAGIRAARMMLPRVYIDETKGARLIECLKRYRRDVPASTGEPGGPRHDEYSHGADALRLLAMIVDQITNDDRPKIVVPGRKVLDPAMGY